MTPPTPSVALADLAPSEEITSPVVIPPLVRLFRRRLSSSGAGEDAQRVWDELDRTLDVVVEDVEVRHGAEAPAGRR
jgi:hypothetical protein